MLQYGLQRIALLWAIPFTMLVIAITGCETTPGRHPFPNLQGSYTAFTSENLVPQLRDAEITTLSDAELESQGYEQIGFISRWWKPEHNLPTALWDLNWRVDTDKVRVGVDPLPATLPAHQSFISSLREQAALGGGHLIRREPDGAYQRESTVLQVSSEGAQWTATSHKLDYQKLVWSVWRHKKGDTDATKSADKSESVPNWLLDTAFQDH